MDYSFEYEDCDHVNTGRVRKYDSTIAASIPMQPIEGYQEWINEQSS